MITISNNDTQPLVINTEEIMTKATNLISMVTVIITAYRVFKLSSAIHNVKQVSINKLSVICFKMYNSSRADIISLLINMHLIV